MGRLILLAVIPLLVAGASEARRAELACSVRPDPDTPPREYVRLANLSEPEAENVALGAVRGPSPLVEAHDLELYDGCLVYAVDVHVGHELGADEVLVDAGNGTVLRRVHQDGEQEAVRRERLEDGVAPDAAP